MYGNTFGNVFRLTTFGESHGKLIGGVIDGCPSGLKLDMKAIQHELNRRKPGQSVLTSNRLEEDKVDFVSGLFKGRTLGTPIAFFISNNEKMSCDYDVIEDIYRPSHADYTYEMKYGIRDHRGGGRSSARETAARVVAGSVAKQILGSAGVRVVAYVSQVHDIELQIPYQKLDLSAVDSTPVRCPDKNTAQKMIRRIESVKKEGDSLGGVITCISMNVPAGWGEPVFSKLHAELGKAILGINAVKGFEYGSGFSAATRKGSEHNDLFVMSRGKLRTATNFSGGVQGGISNGEDIYFRAVFKPTATIMKKQVTVNRKLQKVNLMPGGRHDPCVLPRAVPIVEAMTALTLVDFFLLSRIQSRKV